MAQLKDYPFINQLNAATLDGGVDNNKWENCVLCALTSVILYYHPEYRGRISPDSIKDTVYGPGYIGPTDITRFLAYATQHGVAFASAGGSNATLVQAAHRALNAGYPVIMTEVDPYVDTNLPAYAGWLHSGTFFADGPGTLTMMDPFGGKLVEKSDSEWEAVLRTGAVWIARNDVQPVALTPVSPPPPQVELTAQMKAAGWEDDGTRLWEPGKKYYFKDGFRSAVLKASESYDPANVPLENEHWLGQLEDSHPALGGGEQQLTLLGGFNWNQQYGVIPLAAGAEVQTLRALVNKYYTALVTAQQDIQMLFALAKQQGILFEEKQP